MDCDCFAMRRDGRCGALTVSHCCPETCKFYRTCAENDASAHEAMQRLAAMEGIDQEYLSEKYYDGKMPWNERN